MNIFEDIWNTPPHFVNEVGTKWWKDESVTKYAQDKIQADCWYIEDKNGMRARVLLKGGEVLEVNQSLEAMLVKIDVLSMLNRGL